MFWTFAKFFAEAVLMLAGLWAFFVLFFLVG